ncbi:hypothetical protein [Hymenobacter canadensis]|uniref:XRE family transcriptional regulator n=1 Tax=Hymenobacter canadensis TaxID=2999067 RepID=A0ABY7LWP1_9BACT|nr:hypothetical protein [Hymenobacter canadensis]WBA44294.1 hypothetical protein O3303_21705 [Hymenobacter canadensis]
MSSSDHPATPLGFPDLSLSAPYSECLRYVQFRLKALPQGDLTAFCAQHGLTYTNVVNLKNGKLKRDEPRLVQKVLRALGVPTEIVRIDIGSGANQYVFGSAELLAQFHGQLVFFDAAAQRASSPPPTT